FRRAEVPTFQEATCQDAQPQFDLIEPRPMFRRKMEEMLMGWIAQECSPLFPPAQGLGNAGEITPRRHEAADVQAPMRIEIIDHPVIAGHGGELLPDIGQMCREVLTGAGRPEMPEHLPRRYP